MNIEEVIFDHKTIDSEKDLEKIKRESDLFSLEIYDGLFEKERRYMTNYVYKDLDCKEKNFIMIRNMNFNKGPYPLVFLNTKSSFLDNDVTIKIMNIKNSDGLILLAINFGSKVFSYGNITFDNTKIMIMLNLFIDGKRNFMDNFEFEKLNLNNKSKEMIYFNLGKIIKNVIKLKKKSNRLLNDSLERCKQNLPDELRLLLELES